MLPDHKRNGDDDMSRFSDRIGITNPRNTIQIESLDEKTRIRLWNVMYENYFSNARMKKYIQMNSKIKQIFTWLWRDHFHLPLDTLRNLNYGKAFDYVRDLVLEKEWHYVYNLIEALVQRISSPAFKDNINKILEQEMCDYYIIGNFLTRVTAYV